ncbi:MAG TPA: hypothetical protein VF659_15275 [Pyrinomonadaceae bacterium]|jgi:hypothetical protein
MIVEAGKTYVRRLRAFSTSRDELALRLRLERTLAHANLHPAWLPASAILCVRKLRGESAAASLAPYGRGGASPEWEREIAARLEALARRAARPAREVVAAGAEAVIFDDQAELLACLVSDWCGGGVETTRWWWQSLFGVREVSAALMPALLSSPEHVPAALEHLSRAGKLSAFARALGAQDARDIRRSVTRKFALRALEDALEQTASPAGRSGSGVATDGEQPGGNDTARLTSRAPWAQFVPQLHAEEFGDEQSCLVGTSLMLLRAPAVVRSPSFAEAVTRCRLGAQGRPESAVSSAPAEDGRGRAGEHERGGSSDSGDVDGHRPGAESDAHLRAADDALRSRIETDEAPKGNAFSVGPETDARKGESEDTAAPVEVQRSGRETGGRAKFSSFVREAERPAETRPTVAPVLLTDGDARAPETFINPLDYEARIRTEFGGVFYLTNLALFLELYGDFTAPLAPGLDLPLWDFVALVGSRLCGERIRRDRVWTLLRKLSGRDEGEEPGVAFAPPEAWRVPPAWLAAFPGRGAWGWKVEEGRLRVRHPRGFLLLDVPSSGDARVQLEVETAVYPSHLRGTLRRASFETAGGAPGTVGWWLGRLMPYVRARLDRALGVRGAKAVGRLVCEHEAQAVVTATRLDVTFSLARLPLEVRFAGLDRDPGWVPAAGRHIAFHYE